jgi:ABC-2 type transport system permease protein
VASRAAELLRYRELWTNLVRRELKVRYKNSLLGFLWTLVNPLMYLVIFTIVLTKFLKSGLPYFPLYLLTGLLAWNMFSIALSQATGSMVGNSNLVKKVYFPREILPLASIGAAGVHFALQTGVLLVSMLAVGYQHNWDAGLLLFPLALVVELLVLIGMSLLFSVLNVYYRDVQHLLDLLLIAWFWMTPIVYAGSFAQAATLPRSGWLWQAYLANPMTAVVMGFQRALYVQQPFPGAQPPVVMVDEPVIWFAKRLIYAALGALVLIAVSSGVFRRLEGRLAEEL